MLTALLQEAVHAGRTVRVRARGGSMHPLIPDGSVVELAPVHRPLRVGDVVAAARGDDLLIHRVVGLGDPVALKGDANGGRDGGVAPGDVFALARRVSTPRGLVMRLDTPGAALVGRLAARVSLVRERWVRFSRKF